MGKKWARLRWLPEHFVAAGITLTTVFCLYWLVINWEAEFVTKRVQCLSQYLEHNLRWIEPLSTILIIFIIHIIARIIRGYREGKMAIATGMFFYSPNTKNRFVKRSEGYIRKESLKCARINILGASGWNTFGKENSPLHEALKTCDEVNVILINPSSEYLVMRAKDVALDTNAYKQEVVDSIEYLKSLRTCGDNPERLKLKMYDSYPVFKYIFLGRYVWVQKYPSGGHVRDSPIIAYQRTPSETGVYGHHQYLFSKRWNSEKLGKYNFETGKLEKT